MKTGTITSEMILTDELFEELFEISDEVERARQYNELRALAKAAGLTKEFERLYAAFSKKYRESQRDGKAGSFQRQQQNVTQFGLPGFPELVCGMWMCDEFGVRAMSPQGELVACLHPIVPTKRLINIQTGREKMEIAFNKDGVWKYQIFDKSTILSSQKIVGAMADFGILATSENSKHLVRYFCDIESMNLYTIPIQKSTSKMGWLDNYETFIPYTCDDYVFDSDADFSPLFDSISTHGKEDIQMRVLRDVRKRGRFEPIIAVAASLASVLVQPCGCLPFILHLYGEAGKGKTVATMLAASVWGNPNENGYIADPRSTITAFESQLDFLNNLPFICDDTAKVKQALVLNKKFDFSDFIYMLCGSSGKMRSNVRLGINRKRTWMNCSITNGERPMTSETSNGGELLRVIEVETDEGNLFRDNATIKETADAIRMNYGYVGRAFIDAVREMGVAEIKTIHGQYVDMIVAADPTGNKEGKQIQSMALIFTAEHILAEHVMKDSVVLDCGRCYDLIRSNAQMADSVRAYDFICNEIRMNAANFGENAKICWGYEKDGFWMINPNAFSEIATKGNFDKKMFMKWAVAKGVSKVDADGRIDKKVNTATIKGRFVFIQKPETGEFTDVTEGIPFTE